MDQPSARHDGVLKLTDSKEEEKKRVQKSPLWKQKGKVCVRGEGGHIATSQRADFLCVHAHPFRGEATLANDGLSLFVFFSEL